MTVSVTFAATFLQNHGNCQAKLDFYLRIFHRFHRVALSCFVVNIDAEVGMRLFYAGFAAAILFVPASVFAQSYGTNATPAAAGNPAPVVQATNAQQNTIPLAPPAIPTVPQTAQTPQTGATEKPAVTIIAQGTVLTEEQKKLIAEKLREIPGVVMISDRIHVVGIGQINEPAGAATTNRNRNPVAEPAGANTTNRSNTSTPSKRVMPRTRGF